MAGRDTPADLQDAPVYGHGSMGQSTLTVMEPGASMLDADYARKLARECYTSSTNWINSGRRAKWNDSLRAFQGLHPTGSKYLSGDYRYRSKLFRPKTRAMVRKAEASTAAAFFANEDVVNISAQDDNDQAQRASAEIMQRLLQYRLTQTIPWFQTLVGARQDAEVMGICVGKAYWKFKETYLHTVQRPRLDPRTGLPDIDFLTMTPVLEDYDVYRKGEDHPWIDLVAPENFRFDPGADWRNPVATSPYTIELIPMYVSDVRERIDSGDWLPVSDGALRASSGLDDDQTRRSREQGRVPGKDHDAWKPGEFDICWVRENIIRTRGDDWHYFTLGGAGELLTNPRPVKEVYLQGIRPYVCGTVLVEAHKTFPSAKVELIKDLQTQTNDVTNLRLDNVKLAINPRQFIRRGAQVDLQDARTFMPAKVIVTENPKEDVVWDRPPDVTQASYEEQDRLNLDYDELVGGTSNSSIQGNRQVYEAVGNMELMAGNASTIEEYDQRVFAETFAEPLIRQLVKLEQAYETDPVILAMAGAEAQLWQKFGISEITDELLKQELTVKVNVGLGATNPKVKLMNLATGIELLGKVYGPMAAMATDPEELVKEVFGLCGYKDGMRFFQKDFDFKAAMTNRPDPEAEKAKLEMAKHESQMKLEQAKQEAQAKQDALSQQIDLEGKREESKLRMMEAQMEAQQKARQAQTDSALQMQQFREKLAMELQLRREERSAKLHDEARGRIEQRDHEIKLKGMLEPDDYEDQMKEMAQAVFALAQQMAQAHQGVGATSQEHGQLLGELLRHTATGHQSTSQMMQELARGNQEGYQALAKAIEGLAKAQAAPRKRRAIRDDKGKLIGAEDFT